MWKPLFGRRSPVAVEEDEHEDHSSWSLPDMEAAPPHESGSVRLHAPTFQYDETQPYPAGSYIGELAGWRALDDHRIGWAFRVVPQGDYEAVNREALVYVTGIHFRPDNHLGHLLLALGAVPEVRTVADLARPELQPQLREAVRNLDADALLGRRCRIRVVQQEDDLGNVGTHVVSVTPAGWD